MVSSSGNSAPQGPHCHISIQKKANDDLKETLGSLNDELLYLTLFLWVFANISHVLHLNILIAPLLARYMELATGPSEATAEKEKDKKAAKAPRGKEDKDQMKYKFQGEDLKSKVTTDRDKVSATNLGHTDIDELKQRVIVNPTTENTKKIRKSGLAKAAGFPPALMAPKLVMACREAY